MKSMNLLPTGLPLVPAAPTARLAVAPLLLAALLCCLAGPAHAAPVAKASGPVTHSADPWWKHAVIYEIYPRSFEDTNGDGTGDLNGITKRLDHLQALGVTAIWIAPMFPSPQIDFGYDISDYVAVDPQYGTLADMDRLVAEAKKRNIRVLLDMVLNHSSDKHAWFQQSRSSRNNPKRDWYMWADGVGPDKMDPPNNWQSVFGHSAWKYDPSTKQFYYHKFYAEQPDLNWRNPAVEKAMFDVLRFWLDRGIAGFRLDAIPTLFENTDMKDETVIKDASGNTMKNAFGDIRQNETQTNNMPEVHDVLRRMRALVDSYPGDRVLVGETYLSNVGDLNKMYGGAKQDELQLPMDMQVGFINKLDVATFRKNINDAETMIGDNQPLFIFDNHDNARLDRYCTASATGAAAPTTEQCIAIQKLLSTVLFTSRSTALMYYGDEIGMKTTPPERKEDVKDPIGVTGWPLEKGRDGDRTPMQWDAGKNAGFTTGEHPWLPIPASYKTVNVQAEKSDPNSLLTWYTSLTHLRASNSALHSGAMTMLDTSNNNVLSFVRKGSTGGSVVVALNFTAQPQTVTLDAASIGTGSVSLLLTDADALKTVTQLGTITLPPYASWVGEVR